MSATVSRRVFSAFTSELICHTPKVDARRLSRSLAVLRI
jgi:hypothetical protein